MIAIDASVVIPWLNGTEYNETRRLEHLLADYSAFIAPVVVTELLSDPRARNDISPMIELFNVIPLEAGYWERTGQLRSKVGRLGRKAALGDSLLAQACIDADVALLTRDGDFQIFADVGGLKLA